MAAPQVANVLFLLAINIFLFGWLGVLLFWKTDCDPNKAGNQGCSVNPQFTALGQSFQNLYISLAFANILDLIRDSKAAKPVWVLYMFAFVVSSIWVRTYARMQHFSPTCLRRSFSHSCWQSSTTCTARRRRSARRRRRSA